jgi:hypothetical protein
MKLFTRRVLLVGPPAETLAYATDMRTFVSDRIGREVALWSALFGAPLGTMSYATRVAGIADLRAATQGLQADPEYLAKVVAGRDYLAAPAEDSIGVPIHGVLGDQSPPVGSFAGITTAQIANGQYGEAFAWAIDVANHVESASGIPVMVLSSQYGPFGTVTWIGVSADAEGVDASNDALMGDEGYLKLLGSAGDLFLPGSGQQMLATRIA